MSTNENEITIKLAEHAKEFYSAYNEIGECKVSLQAKYKQAVALGVKCGEILIAVKKIHPDTWLKWLKDNTKITDRAAQRYMLLAKRSTAFSALNEQSIIDTYIALDIVKEFKPKIKSDTMNSAGSLDAKPNQTKRISVKEQNAQGEVTLN